MGCEDDGQNEHCKKFYRSKEKRKKMIHLRAVCPRGRSANDDETPSARYTVDETQFSSPPPYFFQNPLWNLSKFPI